MSSVRHELVTIDDHLIHALFGGISVVDPFFLCCIFCFVFLRPVSSEPIYGSVSEIVHS
jgi:hypothetical protein